MTRVKYKPIPELPLEIIQKFKASIDKSNTNGCWEYTGYRDKNGYGVFQYWKMRVRLLAHRLAYFVETGIDPAELWICHKCNNEACCRIDENHVYAGTAMDNHLDRIRSGTVHIVTHPDYLDISGENHYQAKLTNEKVRIMRSLYKPGIITYQEIGDRFGVSQQTAIRVIKRQIWKHVE